MAFLSVSTRLDYIVSFKLLNTFLSTSWISTGFVYMFVYCQEIVL